MVYNGKDQKPEAKDIVVTDKKSGTVLDSKKVIKSISASSSDVVEAGDYTLTVTLNNTETNYTNNATDISITAIDFKIKKN